MASAKPKTRSVKGELDTYELGPILGQGAFCKVYFAKGKETGEEVVVAQNIRL